MQFKRCWVFVVFLLLFYSTSAAGFVCEPTPVQREGARHILREKQSGAVPPENGALRGLAMAWRYGEKKTVELYFKAGIVDFKDISGRTLLHMAADNGWDRLVERGLKCGLDVNEQDNDKLSPLHYTAKEGRLNTAEMLLERGADINIEDWRGQTPLHLAAAEGRTEIAQLLLKQGANPKKRTNYGETAYSLALASGREELAKILQPVEMPFDFEDFEFDGNSMEPVLKPDSTGWAANRVFDPQIARVAGKPRMFFATLQANPGQHGIGYVNLNSEGLPRSDRKIKLQVQPGYYQVSSPFYFSNSDEESSGGRLYTTNYYKWRAGEWSDYINENELNLDGDRLKISSKETILTGSDKKGHWRARDVERPQVLKSGEKTKLFFKARTWPPPETGGSQSIGLLEKTGGQWSKPEPLITANDRQSGWTGSFSGYRVYEIADNSYLFLLSVRRSKQNKPGVYAVYYTDGKIVKSELIFSLDEVPSGQLEEALPSNSSENLSIRGIDLASFQGQTYLYFSVAVNGEKQIISRMEATIPGFMTEKIEKFRVKEPGTVNWKFETDDRISAMPAVANDGTIYIGTLDEGIFYSLSNGGSLNWTYNVGAKIRSAIVGKEGNIYFGSENGNFYALSKDGDLLWKFETGGRIIQPPSQDRSGNIYFGSGDQKLYAVTSEGKLQWTYQAGGKVRHVLVDRNRVYFASHDNNLYALTKEGELIWKFRMNGYPRPGDIDEDGVIYSGSHNPDGHLYAINPDGSLKWKFNVDGVRAAEPVVGEDGTIYLGEILSGRRSSSIYALTSAGKLKWKYKTRSRVSARPLINDGEKIYVGSWDNNFYSLSKKGALRWKHRTSGEIKWRAKFGFRKNLIVASSRGNIFSLKTECSSF